MACYNYSWVVLVQSREKLSALGEGNGFLSFIQGLSLEHMFWFYISLDFNSTSVALGLFLTLPCLLYQSPFMTFYSSLTMLWPQSTSHSSVPDEALKILRRLEILSLCSVPLKWASSNKSNFKITCIYWIYKDTRGLVQWQCMAKVRNYFLHLCIHTCKEIFAFKCLFSFNSQVHSKSLSACLLMICLIAPFPS